MAYTLLEHSYINGQLLGLVFPGTPQSHLNNHEWLPILYRMANVLLVGKHYRMAIMGNLERLSHTLALLLFEYQVDLNHVPILSYYETVSLPDSGTVVCLRFPLSLQGHMLHGVRF